MTTDTPHIGPNILANWVNNGPTLNDSAHRYNQIVRGVLPTEITPSALPQGLTKYGPPQR